MTCSDLDRMLPDLVDGDVEGSQEPEIQSHLKICSECAELVAELRLIASEAGQLSESDEPPARLWNRIALELRAEGLIREPEVVAPQLVATPRRRWNPFWLAPVAAAIVVAGSYLAIHRNSPPSAQPQVANQTSTPAIPSPSLVPQVAQARPAATPEQPATSAPQQASKSKGTSKPVAVAKAEAQANPAAQEPAPDDLDLTPVSTGDDSQFLSELSQRAPSMRATYAKQLDAVNNEIRETRAYLSQYPGDIDARQHLLEVYQQKTMLYQMALDRIQ